MARIIKTPNGIYALCPHCKKENVELIVKFMYQCEVQICKCGKSYTTEMLNLPGPQGSIQTITNVSPELKEEKLKVSDFAKKLDNNITDTVNEYKQNDNFGKE